jgi:hypothetical protein
MGHKCDYSAQGVRENTSFGRTSGWTYQAVHYAIFPNKKEVRSRANLVKKNYPHKRASELEYDFCVQDFTVEEQDAPSTIEIVSLPYSHMACDEKAAFKKFNNELITFFKELCTAHVIRGFEIDSNIEDDPPQHDVTFSIALTFDKPDSCAIALVNKLVRSRRWGCIETESEEYMIVKHS